jgi:hypothetical protein
MRTTVITNTCATLAILLFSAPLFAVDAQRFVIFPQSAQSISTDQDHYSVTLQQGWVASKDNFFQRIFSQKTNGAFELTTTSTFFDGSTAPVDQVFKIDNLAHGTNRPLGKTVVMVALPADDQTRVALKITAYREDTIGNVLKTLENSKSSLPANFLEAPWVGYSTVVSNLMKQFFGTDTTQYPFSWTGDIIVPDVLSNTTTMREHYVLLISPQNDKDKTLQNLDATKLTYDPTRQLPLVGGAPIQDWSFILLHIAKSPSVNIAQLTFESTAAWAVLAESQFFGLTPLTAKTIEDVQAAQNTTLTQLRNEIDLLKKENRFSKLDRAVALTTFADNSIDVIRTACTGAGIADAKCPIAALKTFEGTIRKVFGLHSDTTNELIAIRVKDLQSAISTKLKTFRK